MTTGNYARHLRGSSGGDGEEGEAEEDGGRVIRGKKKACVVRC